MGSRETGRNIEMLWDCQNCGENGILARHRTCPNCGSIKTGTNYVGNSPASRVVKDEDKHHFTGVVDWKCDFCGRMNRSDVNTCAGCGSPKDLHEKDYFDVREDESKKESEKKERERLDSSSQSAQVSSNSDLFNGSSSSVDSSSSIDSSSLGRTSQESNRGRVSPNIREKLPLAGGIFAIFVALIALIAVLIPKNATLTVQSLNWSRSIDIEVEKTFNESDWDLPVGARLSYTREEFHHYDKVIDHYEDVVVTKYKTEVVDHYYTYEDNGDGTAREIEHDVYGSVPYTVVESQPVYKDVPIYKTKYYYEIDRFVHSRYVQTNGSGHTEYWGTVELGDKEREGKRSEKYEVIAQDDKGVEDTYNASYDLWKNLNDGDVIDAKVSIGKHIELVEEGEN